MKNGIKKLLNEANTFFIPILSVLILTLLFYLPRNTSYWNFLHFSPFYAGIYFWQSQRPDIFHSFSAFVLGIFADVMEGTPIGINITTFLILYLISVKFSARFNIRRFSYSWLIFSTELLLTLLFKAIITSILYRQIIPLNLFFMEFLLTAALYPLLARIYIWTERHYIHLEDTYEKI